MALKLKQFVPSDICLSCEVCCRFAEEDSIWSPILSQTDMVKLSRELLVKQNKFKLKLYKDIYICPCFNPYDSKCRIYPNRPFDCKLYPFLLARKGDKIFLGFDLKCPFTEDKQNSDEFKQFKNYLLNFLKQKDIETMIKNNPQLIADYKEDVVFLNELDFL